MIKNWINITPSFMKLKVYYLLLLIIISAVVELCSIGSIFPLIINLLGDSSDNKDSIFQVFRQISDYLGFVNLILLFIFIYFLKSLYLIYFNFFKSHLIRDLENYLTNKLFAKYHDLDFEDFRKIHSGEIIRNLTKEISLYCSGFASFIYFVSETIILFTLLILLFYIDTKATLAVIVVLGILGYVLIQITFKRLSHLGDLRAKAEKDKVQNILGFIRLFPETKLYNALPNIKKLFANFTSTASTSQALFNFLGQIPRIFMELTAFSVLGVLLIISHYFNYSDQEMLILISVFGVVGLRVLPSVSRLLNTAQVLRYNTTSKIIIDNIFSSIEKNISNKRGKKSKLTLKISNKNFSTLELDNISYSFTNEMTNIINKVSLRATSGNPVCISAPSGKGKSTLLEILAGLRMPHNGDIIFHNSKNKKITKPKIAYVGQKVFLFPETIKANLLFGNKLKVDEEKIWHSLYICDMDKFVKNIGLNSKVEEDGNTFSGGQIQRLGLARAVLKYPDILILDEVTSGLDKSIEKTVIKRLHDSLKEMIIIHASHSSIVKNNCKQIISLK